MKHNSRGLFVYGLGATLTQFTASSILTLTHVLRESHYGEEGRHSERLHEDKRLIEI